MTAEQRVETILASIREAIDEDAAHPATTSHREQGTLMRGAMREMRVSFDPGATQVSNELQIEELRKRVARNVETKLIPPPPVVEPTIAKILPRSDVFSGVLSGTAQVLPPRAEPELRAIRDLPPRQLPRAPRYAQPAPPVESRRPPVDGYADDPRYAAPRPQERYQEHYVEPQRNWDDPPYEAQGVEDAYYDQPVYDAPPPPRQRPRALMSPQTTQNTRGSFEDLTEAIMSRTGGERGIEDMTREMLRTYLRNWLDENLPELVERLVREEIERVARGR